MHWRLADGVHLCGHLVQTIFADFVAAAVDPELQERAFMVVGVKSGVFQSLQDCFDVCKMVLVIDSCDKDVVKDVVLTWNPLQKLVHCALPDGSC